MANWSLDGIIKLVRKYYHRMKFNNENGWAKYTPHVMLTSKAQRFVQSEYTRTKNKHFQYQQFLNLNDSSVVQDPNQNHSHIALKCQKKEQLAIANYILILNMAIETPGRTYNKKEFIKALGKVKVQLNNKDEEERGRRRMEQACTEDEGVMASLIDDLFDNVSHNPDKGAEMQPINLNVEQSGEDIINIGADDDVRNGNDDGNSDENISVAEGNDGSNKDNQNNGTEDETNGSEDIECVIGSIRKKVTCRLAKVNNLCFCDVRTKG